MCGQLVAYPLALVRTRLQAPGAHAHYSGMLDCFRKILAADGVKGLYRGLVPNFAKSIPAVAASYAVFEKTKQFLESKQD